MLFSLSGTFRFTLIKVYPHILLLSVCLSLYLYDICVKCQRGKVPPCSKQMYIMYISYCCLVLKRNLKELSFFF